MDLAVTLKTLLPSACMLMPHRVDHIPCETEEEEHLKDEESEQAYLIFRQSLPIFHQHPFQAPLRGLEKNHATIVRRSP